MLAAARHAMDRAGCGEPLIGDLEHTTTTRAEARIAVRREPTPRKTRRAPQRAPVAAADA